MREWNYDSATQGQVMGTYATSSTVEEQGRVLLAGVPFAPGTEVEVTVSPKRRPGQEFAAAWRTLCDQLRRQPGVKDISDEAIRDEIDRHRAGQ